MFVPEQQIPAVGYTVLGQELLVPLVQMPDLEPLGNLQSGAPT